MKTRFTVAVVLTLLGITCGEAWGQAFRFVPRLPVRLPSIPPIHSPIHPPIHIPPSTDPSQQNQQHGNPDASDSLGFVILGSIGFGLLTLLAVVLNGKRNCSSTKNGCLGSNYGAALSERGKSTHGLIRIVTTPPGEAPQSIREAWIGLELPLVRSREQGKKLSVMGVLSWARSFMTGYAVEGQVALEHLAAHSPAAAAWWRENVPHVLKSGFQFIFPVGNCVRLD